MSQSLIFDDMTSAQNNFQSNYSKCALLQPKANSNYLSLMVLSKANILRA